MTKTIDYVAYAVARSTDEKKDRWSRIGAGFINSDKSITVLLDAVPYGSSRLVLQLPKDDDRLETIE